MDISEGTTTDDLWTPYKELVAVVEGYLAHEKGGSPYAVHTFESVLRRHKQTFLSLLKNPAKNSSSREEIKRGISEGVILPSVGRTLLSKELVDEAVIISDMYNVNEYLALELLHTAQRQLPRHPGLPRGIVAVLLYYDGRKSLVQALKELVMSMEGVCWSINARDEIMKYVSRYVEQLISDGLVGNVLDILQRYSLDSELELLQNNRALPPHRHHVKLVATIQNTRKLLAGVIFAASAQRGLDRDILLRLLSEQTSSASRGPTGALDDISLALQMALLYALDLSVLHRRDDGEELAKKLPLIQDPELIFVLLDELSPPNHPNHSQEQEKTSGVRALCQLALGLAMCALKRAPQSLLKGPRGEIKAELLDQDEMLVDAAIDGKVFEYLDEVVLSTELVPLDEYYQRRVHSLLTDFIVLMHSKLMEMRVKADEAARAMQMYAAEGLTPPAGVGQNRTRLDSLLRCVERLYAHDPLGLRNDYWRACDTGTHSHLHRSGGRAATLYKFVRLWGELVCASLLPAYLRALASLCVERHTWALLARRDALSAHHLLTALATYHANLRADPAPFSNHLHASLGASAIVTPAARPGKLLVRQEEVEAMIAALKLIAAVARVDKVACTNICDNLQWDAVNTMFGLVCCHVPIQLKSELCLTLAALGGSASTAGRVWAALEATHLVTVAKDKRALNAELLEVECRMEEYPLSRAFLTLLNSLCASGPLPRALGAGARPHGLDPYLEHVLVRLALPAPHRPYLRPYEKWQVLSLCFDLFVRWLEQYEPSAADFPTDREPEHNPPPGFRLLLQLHTRSELLRLLLTSLDETYEALDSPPSIGKEYVEKTLISVLKMLSRALGLERELISAAAEAGRSLLIVGLSKLILAPEGPDNNDRLVTCCKILRHSTTLPLAAATAVGLLSRALQYVAAAKHLLPHIIHKESLAAEIRHGFVECLEAEEWGTEADVEAIRVAKEGVVVLLQQVLPTAPPNLAHFLLGYQLTEDISQSALNEPGAAGYPRTCLHSILDILDRHISGQNNADREASKLVECCYRLLYGLCARPKTAPPVLRLLRSRDYFLSRHIKATVNLETASLLTLASRSWVLRSCACEAGAASSTRQHAALVHLLTTVTHTAHHPTQEWEWCLLRRTLEGLPVTVEPVDEPQWELFNAQQLRLAISTCDINMGGFRGQKDSEGKRISVSRVHALLARELAAFNVTAPNVTAPQRKLVVKEIQRVLDYVTEVNRRRNTASTLTHYYDSWRQLTEMLFCVAPDHMLSFETKKNLLLNILQDLLNKIPPAEVLPQLGNLASGTILLLLVNLRHCYILQKRDSTLKLSDFETTFFGPSNQIVQTNSLTLKFILDKILSWILVSGGCTQKMRVNLYGALLNYLNIVNLKPSSAEPETEADNTYVSRLDSSKARPSKEVSSLKSMVIDLISGFGDNLCTVVCSDCIGGGHDVCRVVALSCLDTLIDINPKTDWMNTMTNQGYLRSLIDSLLQDDEGLKEALEHKPKSMKVLYVYETKMSLLIKISCNRIGAETVLSQGALSCLANLTALHSHPDIHTGYAAHRDTEFVPSVANRFRQIFIPAMTLCDALLTTLGTQNHSCVIHVTHLLISHLDCIDTILRAAHPSCPDGLLLELEAVTSVVSRASNSRVLSLVQHDPKLAGGSAGLARLRSLMLSVLPRYRNPPLANPAIPDSRIHYKIVCNVLTYAKNMMDLDSPRGCFPTGVPRPTGVHPDTAPYLGNFLMMLQSSTSRTLMHQKLLATAYNQLQAMPHMTCDDLKKLLPSDSCEVLPPSEARAQAAVLLRRRVYIRRLELMYCAHAVEVALYLVWAHLYIFLRASETLEALRSDPMSRSRAWRDVGSKDLQELRKELVVIFNERFTEDLLETVKNQPPTHRGFTEIMIKDIKSMIQFSTLPIN